VHARILRIVYDRRRWLVGFIASARQKAPARRRGGGGGGGGVGSGEDRRLKRYRKMRIFGKWQTTRSTCRRREASRGCAAFIGSNRGIAATISAATLCVAVCDKVPDRCCLSVHGHGAHHNTRELSIFNDDSGNRATAATFHDDKSHGRKRFARTKRERPEGEGNGQHRWVANVAKNVTTKGLSGNYLCVIDGHSRRCRGRSN